MNPSRSPAILGTCGGNSADPPPSDGRAGGGGQGGGGGGGAVLRNSVLHDHLQESRSRFPASAWALPACAYESGTAGKSPSGRSRIFDLPEAFRDPFLVTRLLLSSPAQLAVDWARSSRDSGPRGN